MTHKEFERYEADVVRQVGEISSSGYYRKVTRAEGWIERRLRRVWAPLVGLTTEDDLLSEELGMAPTDILIVHFFGAGILRFGSTKSAPALTAFRPIFDPVADMVRFGVRSVAKGDLAKIVGKSRSAVDASIHRLRHGNRATDVFYAKKLAVPMFVPTGILLDLATSVQCTFRYAEEDYAYAEQHARDSKNAIAPTLLRQIEHCSDALRTVGVSIPNRSADVVELENPGTTVDVSPSTGPGN